jgi:hypothetical protein
LGRQGHHQRPDGASGLAAGHHLRATPDAFRSGFAAELPAGTQTLIRLPATRIRSLNRDTDVFTELKDKSCRTCRSQLGLDDSDEANGRLEVLFVISITLGLRASCASSPRIT